MARSKQRARTPLAEAALGLALGAVAGCLLGATEAPVARAVSAMTSEGLMQPVTDEVRTVGPLGLGTLLGATALTTAMTSIVAGVMLAAAIASAFLAAGSCASQTQSVGLWASAGLAGALGATLSGATMGVAVEWMVGNLGMVALLWALGIFTAVKPAIHFLLKVAWQQGEACRRQGPAALARQREREATETRQRERVTVQMEQRILALERGGAAGGEGADLRGAWEQERRQRAEEERERAQREEEEMEQRTLQDWINGAVLKYLDFLAFSGVPMTATAIVTSCFGVWGYGGHQSALVALLGLVAALAYWLLRSPDFKFWMLVGCMGMLATFVIAMLTLHAGQEAVVASTRLRAAGTYNHTRESIAAHMDRQSALEALSAAFFVAKLCQLGFGATVGGPLVRRGAGEGRVIAGAAALAAALLALVEVSAPVLGEGGRAGALLGAVGAAGVSVGAAAAMAGGWSSWAGTLGTLLGLAAGALGVGTRHVVNIGLQVGVAYVFAMTNPL